jgi:hypothetical protein
MVEIKQTAVDWLVEEIHKNSKWIPTHIIEQAKAMEKEQIIDAATWGGLHESAEQYYKQTYGK